MKIKQLCLVTTFQTLKGMGVAEFNDSGDVISIEEKPKLQNQTTLL